MSNLAYYSTFYSLLSELYFIAYNLQVDPKYERLDAVNDLLEVLSNQSKQPNQFLRKRVREIVKRAGG
jgi:hypothetical protein